jgi:hypothetical protein
MMFRYLFPTKPGVYTRKASDVVGKDGLYLPGCYRVTYEQRHGRIAILKPVGTDGRVSTEAQWSGTTFCTHIEINEIVSNGGTVHLIDGFFYEPRHMKPIFRDFVDTLYKRRLRAEADGNDALKLVVKLLLNNLYGKFGIGETGNQLVQMTTSEADALIGQEGVTVTPLTDLGDDVYAVSEPMMADYSFPAIAAFITAHARLNLLAPANHHGVGIIYCDTDSIHTQSPFPAELINAHELGRFKCETTKHKDGCTFVYGGRKIYVNETTSKTKCKGVPTDAIRGTDLTGAIMGGQSVSFDYSTPTPINSAIRGGVLRPNKFEQKSRRVRGTPSTRAKGLLREPA